MKSDRSWAIAHDRIAAQRSRRRISIPVDWFAALCATVVFARLIYSTKELSYDFAFYERFVNVLKYTTGPQFFDNVFENAPYFIVSIQQGYYNYSLSFEAGFSALCFMMAQVLPNEAILPTIAAASIYIKMTVLRSFGVPVIILVGVFVFFIALLETNALRAGLAQAIALAGFFAAFKSGRLFTLLLEVAL